VAIAEVPGLENFFELNAEGRSERIKQCPGFQVEVEKGPDSVVARRAAGTDSCQCNVLRWQT
jgi:hypothetical protein